MKLKKKQALEAAGWRVGTVRTFLDLSDTEVALVDMKIALAKNLRERRLRAGVSQVRLAELIESSQSRVAKMEAADPTVSLDLLVRALLALGARRSDIAKAVA